MQVLFNILQAAEFELLSFEKVLCRFDREKEVFYFCFFSIFWDTRNLKAPKIRDNAL
jgi:hypothetical protein